MRVRGTCWRLDVEFSRTKSGTRSTQTLAGKTTTIFIELFCSLGIQFVLCKSNGHSLWMLSLATRKLIAAYFPKQNLDLRITKARTGCRSNIIITQERCSRRSGQSFRRTFGSSLPLNYCLRRCRSWNLASHNLCCTRTSRHIFLTWILWALPRHDTPVAKKEEKNSGRNWKPGRWKSTVGTCKSRNVFVRAWGCVCVCVCVCFK